MSPKKLSAAGDLQVADNGTFTINLKFKDADGVSTSNPTGLSAQYVASDATPGPSALDLTPSADGSSCAGAIDQAAVQTLVAAGTPLPEGLTVSITATWDGQTTPQTVVAAPPIDVVPGPANSFVAEESTP